MTLPGNICVKNLIPSERMSKNEWVHFFKLQILHYYVDKQVDGQGK